MPVCDASDGSLVRRFRQGEADAATALYARYARRLTALADAKTGDDLKSRFDADDVVQSVFRTFFRRVSGGSYDVPDGEELWGLLLVVTLNKTRKLAAYHRAEKRDVRASGADPDTAFAIRSGKPGDSMEQLRLVIDEFSESLDPLQQRVVELRVEGREVREIAAELGRSKRTIERVLQGIRKSLRDQIDE